MEEESLEEEKEYDNNEEDVEQVEQLPTLLEATLSSQ